MAERGWEGSAESLNCCWNMINPSESAYEAPEPTYLQRVFISHLLFLSFDFWPVPLETCMSKALFISFCSKNWKTMLPFSLLVSKVFLSFMLEARADLLLHVSFKDCRGQMVHFTFLLPPLPPCLPLLLFLFFWHFYLLREPDLYVNTLMHIKYHLHWHNDMITLCAGSLLFLRPQQHPEVKYKTAANDSGLK